MIALGFGVCVCEYVRPHEHKQGLPLMYILYALRGMQNSASEVEIVDPAILACLAWHGASLSLPRVPQVPKAENY